MKLLFFASDFKIGLSSLLVDECLALDAAGIPMVVVAGEKEQEDGLSERISPLTCRVVRIKGLDEHSGFKAKASSLATLIKECQTDVVHVQNNWQLALCAYCKYLLGCRIQIVYTLHGFRHNSFWKSIAAQIVIGTALLLFADKVICMCQYLKDKFRLLSYKIVLLPLGISDNFFTDKHDLNVDAIRAIFPAQFRHGKNQQMLINAFACYVKQSGDTDAQLILPGSGPLLDDMKRLAERQDVSGQVSFPGQCSKDEVLRLYRECNIGLVSSNSETFGQSIVEPFVLGRCVVTRRVGIATDIIKEGINGFFFDNEDDLYNIFIRLGKNKSLISETGRNNFTARDMFRWREIADKYKKLICGLQ